MLLALALACAPAPVLDAPPGRPPATACAARAPDAPLRSDVVLGRGPHAVGWIDLDLTDADRHAPDGRARALPTRIAYPAAAAPGWLGPAPVAPGRHPLIVHAHGFSSSLDEAADLQDHLASWGFVVAAPTFPGTNLFAPGGPRLADVVNQPGDVAHLLDTLTGAPPDVLRGAVDADRIGVIGVSLGGLTALLTAYHPTLRDPRVDAVVAMAAPTTMLGEAFYRQRDVPLLALHGDDDAIVPYDENARPLLARAPGARLVTLLHGSHTGFASVRGEALVFGALGLLLAADGAHPDNPDGVGCGAILDLLADQRTDPFEPLGGAEAGLVPSAPTPPCTTDALTRATLPMAVQRARTAPAVAAFLRAHLDPDPETRARWCHALDTVVAAQPGVAIEVAAPR